MYDLEKKLSVIGQGRVSEQLLPHIQQRIKSQQEKALNQLETAYRSGKTDAVTLSSGIAAYCALKDLLESMENEVRSANRVQKELNERANTDRSE